ncbi:hypothetical protein D1AOALGA4SA_11661 [Olavius algarvensis Delta 1 endosymbiont]|nr:hypothetical protein D1AOALGA4SA_11661 [Olavius algarvensis Delta 1 endosymbiont]
MTGLLNFCSPSAAFMATGGANVLCLLLALYSLYDNKVFWGFLFLA